MLPLPMLLCKALPVVGLHSRYRTSESHRTAKSDRTAESPYCRISGWWLVIGLMCGVVTLCPTGVAEEKQQAAATDKQTKPEDAAPKDTKDAKDAKEDKNWISLFNGKDLDGWKITEFGGQGEVYVENGEVVISQGVALSGIHTERKLPKINYEVQFEAQRAAGSDFFAGLTFPVNETFCSLILGGWGGGLCGLSSLDGMDASENQTTSYQQFDKEKWYKVRLLVTEEKIEAWLDGKQIVEVETKNHRIGVRFEVERSQPFGFSTWQTTGRLRNVRLRPVPAPVAPAK